jgi:hypothetical protein
VPGAGALQLIARGTMQVLSEAMCLHHPSRTVQNTPGCMAAQRADWREVGRVLSALNAITARSNRWLSREAAVRGRVV